jgi:hypothetical protein
MKILRTILAILPLIFIVWYLFDRYANKNSPTKALAQADTLKLSVDTALQATSHSSDESLRDRTTHTGVQSINTIRDLQASLELLSPKANPKFSGVVETSKTGESGLKLKGLIGKTTSHGDPMYILAFDNATGDVLPSVIPDHVVDVGINTDGENTIAIYRSNDNNPEVILLSEIGTKTKANLRILLQSPYQIVYVIELKGFFYYDSADTTTVDDNATIIVTQDGKRYKKVHKTDAELQSSFNLKVDKVAGKQLSTEDFSNAEKTKLGAIATGATANSTDATLLSRTNHTGVQAISTVTGLQTALDGKLPFIVSATYAAIPAQTGANYKIILVLADEQNNNYPTLYAYDGTGLQWITSQKIY